jgi:hypothetical protein
VDVVDELVVDREDDQGEHVVVSKGDDPDPVPDGKVQ